MLTKKAFQFNFKVKEGEDVNDIMDSIKKCIPETTGAKELSVCQFSAEERNVTVELKVSEGDTENESVKNVLALFTAIETLR